MKQNKKIYDGGILPEIEIKFKEMTNFEKCISVVLLNEGGYIDHPADPGGATNFGISFKFLSAVDEDINSDGIVDIGDIKSMTISDAKRLYKKYFWNKYYDALNNPLLSLHIFDMGVNAGKRTSIKLIQRIVEVEDDGIIGTNTVKAINNYIGDIVDEYKIARIHYYRSLVEKNSKLGVFLNGWINRVNHTKF